MPRKLHLAVAVYGVGGPGQHGLWKDPRVPNNASTDIRYYIKTAQVAEQALFDALFIVDSQFINATYPSQGQPVIFQAGVSEDGRNLAAHVAEGIYAPGGSTQEAQAYYADIKRRAAELGRDPDHVVIFTGASPVVGSTDEDAQRLSREIYEADNDFDRKLGFLGRAFGAYDFSQHDLDAPFPDVAHLAEKGGRTRGLELVQRAKEQGLTLRQVVDTVTEYHPSPFTGAPDTVAAAIADWYEGRAADGLNLRFRTIDDLEQFAGDVVPLLQKRGLFRTEYEGDTLRDSLGLPFPVNRHTLKGAGL